jgi:hypothetical protein
MAPVAAVPTPLAIIDDESSEDVTRRASANLALLIWLAASEQRGERLGDNPELDAAAWYAIEGLLITTRNDVQRLDRELTGLQNAQRAQTRGGAR